MILLGAIFYFFVRVIINGFFTVDQNERAVLSSFGRAHRLGDRKTTDTPMADMLSEEEEKRYSYPQLVVIGPGLHFKWPWQQVHKASIATETISMAYDTGRNSQSNKLEAVTKDQLNIDLTGQIRFKVSEQNLYAYFFGILDPLSHITGFFVSILREKIANFEPKSAPIAQLPGMLSESENVSINDLRKNLRDINDHMVQECKSSAARYGIVLEASLITSIDPPNEVEAALAAINTAHNNVSAEISLAKATADQTIVQSRRAVEIETLKAQAEVEPLLAMSQQLQIMKSAGPLILKNFVRNNRLEVMRKAKKIIQPMESSK